MAGFVLLGPPLSELVELNGDSLPDGDKTWWMFGLLGDKAG
jgi:hypothetical protein